MQQEQSPQYITGKSTFEGGTAELTIKQRPFITNINDDAKMRKLLRHEVVVCSAYKTLFYGLKWNHEHNVAVLHPILFVLRRVIFTIVIIFMIGENVIFGALLLILSTLVMLTFVALEA